MEASPVTLSRDFSTSTYSWGLMKNNHTTGDTSAQKDAVARLMSDVGIAFQMVYGPASSGGSGASTMYGVTVFPTYFRYANTISGAYRAYYSSDSAWMQVFKNEVQNGRPSQLRLRDPAAGGHSVVVDGYRDSPSEQIHINFGWGGSYDGWYVTSNIVTGGYSWSDVNYQAAVIGISPTPLPTVASVTATPLSPQPPGRPSPSRPWRPAARDPTSINGGSLTGPPGPSARPGARGAPSPGRRPPGDPHLQSGSGTPGRRRRIRQGGPGTMAFSIVVPNRNLAAYQPPGWSDAVVVAAGSGGYRDVGTYGRGQTYFLSFAVGNYGTGSTRGVLRDRLRQRRPDRDDARRLPPRGLLRLLAG